MATYTLTVELPESVFQQLARIAQLTNQSLETIVAQTITSNLPPSADNAPPQMQKELLKMQTLPITELLEITRTQVPVEQQQQHLMLLEKNQSGSITNEERQQLIDMRTVADEIMVCKAYAWSVLRWRGYRVPAFEDLPQE
ncbi:MAG: hypothetical protein PUP92_14305 [Rhizonema sp. PD38]|nr:hypothetical protein [Rhizonema sp. PD38]